MKYFTTNKSILRGGRIWLNIGTYRVKRELDDDKVIIYTKPEPHEELTIVYKRDGSISGKGKK